MPADETKYGIVVFAFKSFEQPLEQAAFEREGADAEFRWASMGALSAVEAADLCRRWNGIA